MDEKTTPSDDMHPSSGVLGNSLGNIRRSLVSRQRCRRAKNGEKELSQNVRSARIDVDHDVNVEMQFITQ